MVVARSPITDCVVGERILTSLLETRLADGVAGMTTGVVTGVAMVFATEVLTGIVTGVAVVRLLTLGVAIGFMVGFAISFAIGFAIGFTIGVGAIFTIVVAVDSTGFIFAREGRAIATNPQSEITFKITKLSFISLPPGTQASLQSSSEPIR